MRGLSFYLISAAAATLSRRLARFCSLFLSSSSRAELPPLRLVSFTSFPSLLIYFASLLGVFSFLHLPVPFFFLSPLSFFFLLILFSYVSVSFLPLFPLLPSFSPILYFLLPQCLSSYKFSSDLLSFSMANLFKLPWRQWWYSLGYKFHRVLNLDRSINLNILSDI